MKNFFWGFILFCLSAVTALATDYGTAGVYVGGHFRRQRTLTVPNLKNSGFTYAILFNVNVEENGNLTMDGEILCSNGVYRFTEQPHYQDDVAALANGYSTIKRVEICIGGWNNQSYFRIKDLIASQGTGSASILYKNFKALKDAIPNIEAVNNDDEHCYDVSSAVAFHTMMYDLGYVTTIAPYTNKNFWTNFATQLNAQRRGAVDRMDLQCYSGGAGNNPNDWKISNIPILVGYEYFGDSDAEPMKTKFINFKNTSTAQGGFIWVYNSEEYNMQTCAGAINAAFDADGGVLTNDLTAPSNQILYIRNKASGRYLTADGSISGSSLSLTSFSGSVQQQWQLAANKGIFRLRNPSFRLCVLVADTSRKENAATLLTSALAETATHQNFYFVPNGQGGYRIVALHSFMVLAAENDQDNARLIQIGDTTNTLCNWELIKPSEMGIDPLAYNREFRVYPSPADDQLFIESDAKDITRIEIADLRGNTLYEQNGDGNQINVSQFTAGMYLVKIHSLNEGGTWMGKWVKR